MAVIGPLYLFQPNTQPFMLFKIMDSPSTLFGHLLFSSFGGFVGYLGGPILQVAFPLSLSFYLFASGKLFITSLALFWSAQSFFDVALYAKDARARTFILMGGPDHIWHEILGRLGLLELDQFVSTLIYLGGVLALFAALMLGLLAARKPMR